MNILHINDKPIMNNAFMIAQLCGVLIFLAPYLANAEKLNNPVPILVGAYVNQNLIRNIDIVKERDEHWILLDDLAGLTGIKVADKNDESEEDIFEFATPIGKANLPVDKLAMHQGRYYVSAPMLKDAFNIGMLFSSLDFALYLDVPWRPGAPMYDEPGDGQKPAITPDIPAPDGSWSFIRSANEYNKESNAVQDSQYNTLDTGGRVASGAWVLGLERQNGRDNDTRLRNYSWSRTFDRAAIRAGSNYIDLNPLLQNYRFTGGQYAFDNRGIERFTDFDTNLNLESFLSDDIRNQENIIRDDGPPGGIAELRINDVQVALVRIGLNGHYEFRDIPRIQGVFQTIKVFLYERSLGEVPLATLDFTSTISLETLPAGELYIRAGAGDKGNSLYSDEIGMDKGTASFFRGRHGVTDGITLLGIAQNGVDDRTEGLAGARIGIGHNWNLAFDAAANSENTRAYATELRGLAKKWDVNLRGRYFDRGYRSNMNNEEYDYYLRSFYQVAPSFRLGLFGRKVKENDLDELNYLKPGFNWRPGPSFLASAIPNIDGEYRISAYYYLSPSNYLSIFYEQEYYTALFDMGLSEYLNFRLGYENDREIKKDFFLGQIYWYPFESQNDYFQAGVTNNLEDTGFLVSWNKIVTPGIEFSVEYDEKYRIFAGDEKRSHFFARLRVDFANTGKRLAPVDNRYVNFTRGGISGAIYDEQGNKLNIDDLSVRVNGFTLAQRGASAGNFYVGMLRPGVYTVELDEEKLPIELVPAQRSYAVEVAGLAVTEVNFTVRAEYGFAGQVTSSNQEPVANAFIQVRDASGQPVTSGITDQFGYYRVDGLVAGEYTATCAHVNGEALPEPHPVIQVQVTDDYLFDQDLSITLPDAPPPAE